MVHPRARQRTAEQRLPDINENVMLGYDAWATLTCSEHERLKSRETNVEEDA